MSAAPPESPIRVAHVTWGLGLGGLEQLLLELARHTDRQRFALHFISLSSRGVLGPEIERLGWPVTALEQGEGLRPGLILQLASLFRGQRIEVVHTHNTRALVYGGPAARLACVGRLIHTWHGQNLLASPREALLFRLGSLLPDAVVAVSEDAARFMARQGVPARRLHTILNGVDTQRFAVTGPQRDGPLVTVARLSPEKDLATLLRALAQARQTLPELTLEVAGAGPCLGELRELAHSLGLNSAVHFLGQVRDVPALLARARLFVLPSLTEGISLTLLEAQACGLPVVATKVGGNPEVVGDGETGLLVPPGNPAELAAAIVRLAGAPEMAKAMGAAGRRRVEQRFDVGRMIANYEDLYYRNLRRRPVVVSGPTSPRPWRVLTNITGLEKGNADGLATISSLSSLICDVVPLKKMSPWELLPLWLRSHQYDAVVMNQAPKALALFCALNTLWPFHRPALISVDLVLARPELTWGEWFKALAKRLLLDRVSLFLMHLKEAPDLKRYYNIGPDRLRYVPFKVNEIELLRHWPRHEGSYVFTGGRSRRDYRTFCTALAGLPYPAQIVTPQAQENAEHGTDLTGLQPPPNVALVHDDGSFTSWVQKMAEARLVVFCISSETISPSGVSAYLVAMALEKCVIISDCPATHGILRHEETAILVPMCDPAALQAAIRRAWEDDDYRQRIAAGGRRYALSLGGEDVLMRNLAREVRKFLDWRQMRM